MTKVAETVSENQMNALQNFNDDFTTYAESNITEETTENSFYNITEFTASDISTEYINASNSTQNFNVNIYSLYPTELLWFGAIACILITLIGTTGNFISILALVKCKRLRNATTVFIVNLCASDMLFCSFTVPMAAATFIDTNWEKGDVLCKLLALVKYSNGMASFLTIAAITINRYILIVHPSLYQAMYTKRNIAISIACLWLFPLSLLLLPLFNVWGTLAYNPKAGDCGVMNLNGKSPKNLIFVVATVLPSILFIACYLRIYFVVKKSAGNFPKPTNAIPKTSSQSEFHMSNSNCESSKVYCTVRDNKELRVVRIALVIFIFYVVSNVPIFLLKLFGKESELPLLNVLAYILFLTSSVVNPLIYIVMSTEYRAAYKMLFSSKLC